MRENRNREQTLHGLHTATRSYSGHLDTQRKARDHYFPCSGHNLGGNNNQEQFILHRVVKSHLSLPSLLFHWDSIPTVCGATTASARRRESQALPHTNHPLGQTFLAHPQERHCLGWAPQLSFGRRLRGW